MCDRNGNRGLDFGTLVAVHLAALGLPGGAGVSWHNRVSFDCPSVETRGVSRFARPGPGAVETAKRPGNVDRGQAATLETGPH